MRLTSLIYIKEMLEEELHKQERWSDDLYKKLQEKYNEEGAEEFLYAATEKLPNDGIGGNIKSLRKARQEHRDKESEIRGVLDDLLSQDFK